MAALCSTSGLGQRGWPAPFLRLLLRNEASAPERDDSVPPQSVSALRARAPSAVSWRALPSSLGAPPPILPPPGARSAQTRLFVSAGILGEAEAAAMPGKLKVKIVAGRHLPVMDRASDLTDAFVEVGSWSCPSEHGTPIPALPAVPGSVEGCPPAPSPRDVAVGPRLVPPPGSR